jgi:sugar lactone lactonase YvrE
VELRRLALDGPRYDLEDELATGASTTLADSFQGLSLNWPNDVTTGPDGAIWFTDPSYVSCASASSPSLYASRTGA